MSEAIRLLNRQFGEILLDVSVQLSRKETMPRDLSEIADDYCRENYGHSNWGYLDHYTKHEPEKLVDASTYDIEDGKVFWHEEDREEDLQQC